MPRLGLCMAICIRYQPVKISLREAIDGEPDVELDLGLPGHCHQLRIEEELDPSLLDIVDEALVGRVGVGGHRHQQLVAPQHRGSEKRTYESFANKLMNVSTSK